MNDLAKTLDATLFSVNEEDRFGEKANVVDGLFAIARALERVASAISNHPGSSDLDSLTDAVNAVADAVAGRTDDHSAEEAP